MGESLFGDMFEIEDDSENNLKNEDIINYEEEVIDSDDIGDMFKSLEDIPTEDEEFKEYTIEEIMEEEMDIWAEDEVDNSGYMEKYDLDIPNFSKPISEDIDILGGVEELRERTGKNLEDDWEQTAGEEILYSGDGETMGELTYPILLLQIQTEDMFKKVTNLIKGNSVGDEVTFLTQVDDVAVNIGKGNLNFNLHERFTTLGLEPIYFPRQGETKEYTPLEFFDAREYEPFILAEDEIEEETKSTIIPEGVEEIKGYREDEEYSEHKSEDKDDGLTIPIELMTDEEREQYQNDKDFEDLVELLGDSVGEVFEGDLEELKDNLTEEKESILKWDTETEETEREIDVEPEIIHEKSKTLDLDWTKD